MPDLTRITSRLEQLWQLRRGPGGGADRPAYSAAEAAAMMLTAGWSREAGLVPCLDRHGNLWALPAEWDGPLLTSGSHLDTVPDGGRYDGALGTVLGLELVHELSGGPAQGPRPALLVCAAEEAPRFGAGTIGSRLLAGSLAEAALEQMHDAEGTTAAQARAGYLRALGELPTVEAPTARVRAHAEVHIAQRRSLRELGVVTRVASPRRFEVEFAGEAGHAGEVSMEDRRDALAAASELVLAVERAARAEPAETVATVGALSLEPGAVSVIPAHVRLEIDTRGISSESLRRLEETIRADTGAIAGRRGVAAQIRLLRGGEPVCLDRRLADTALTAAGRMGIAAGETWSGAGHDAQHLASLMPTLLLFVPLAGGQSHMPDEHSEPADIITAARVARATLAGVRSGTPRTDWSTSDI